MTWVRLYFRPRPAPAWWPCRGGRSAWAGVLDIDGSGWILGDGVAVLEHAVPAMARAVQLEFPNAEFQERKVRDGKR